jgi:putative addiction module killer protein
MSIELLRYETADGSVPLDKWVEELRDRRMKTKLEIRLRRVATGVYGDVKAVGEGVMEMREDIGPGFRIYFARQGTALVVLLCAGTKQTQHADIEHAKDYWRDWKRRNK